jgi:hypothetical protein
VGTHWERRKNEKILLPPSKEKRTKGKKKQGTLSACLGVPIGCMAFLFPKEFVTILGLGLYPLQRTLYPLNKEAREETCNNHHPQENFAI